MKKNNLIAATAFALCNLLVCLTLPAHAAQDPLAPLSPTRSQVLEGYHQTGLNGDRSRVPEMLPILKSNDPRAPKVTVLLVLASLVTEAA